MCFSFSEKYQAYYYYNVDTKQSQWIHPQDTVYKIKVEEARARLLDTASEEVDSGIRSGEKDGGAAPMEKRLGGKFIAPLEATLMNTGELKPLGRVDQIRRQFDVQRVVEVEGELKKPPVKGFTLTGMGSMFLKSSTAKKPPTTLGDDGANRSLASDAATQPSVKGILRDSSLTDVYARPRNNESGQETEKSVRFSLFGPSTENADQGWPTSNAAPQGPSSALTKNLNLNSDSEGTSADDDFEEQEQVIEDVENDDDAWTPRPPCQIKVVTSTKPPAAALEMNNMLVKKKILNPIENKKALDEESSRFDEEIGRIRTANEEKLHQFVMEEEMALQMMLEAKREEIEIDKQRSLTVIESQLEAKLQSVRAEMEESYSLDAFRKELKLEFEAQRRKVVAEHRASVDLLEKNHQEIIQDLERDLKSQEELIKKEHANKRADLKSTLTLELETERIKMRESGEDRLYEKLRCEKRLLEDKYRCLKDRYNRLKTDVKLSVEKRNNRRREKPLQPTVASESEKRIAEAGIKMQGSFGDRAAKPLCQSSRNNYAAEDTTSISISEATASHTQPRMNYSAGIDDSDSEAFFIKSENQDHSAAKPQKPPPRPISVLADSPDPEHCPRDRKKQFSRTKSASTSRLHSSNLVVEGSGSPCTPVENLRRQLKKLEDLEDQFPENTLEATYHLRYPFGMDTATNYENRSSELEFFKHRIHLERDALSRAKGNLKSQRDNFRAKRERLLHQHFTVEELMGEEKDLTEMEVNLHRTRALLGEKVIRLRHLEQSLQRFVDHKNESTTLSDLSSHSSSGFSSTDFVLSADAVNLNKGRKGVESTTDILKNLETLNSEIREIWEILKQTTTSHTGTYYSGELDWSFNATTAHLPLTQNAGVCGASRNCPPPISQSPVAGQYTSTLVERTRDLRNWLRQAKQEHLLAQKHTHI